MEGAETSQLGEVVGVAVAEAAVVVAEREIDVQHVLGPGHGDIEQSAFLVNARFVGDGHVRGDHSVGGVENVHNVPLAALRGVDGAENEVVFLPKRRLGEVRGRPGRIEGEVGDQSRARAVSRGDLNELIDVAAGGWRRRRRASGRQAHRIGAGGRVGWRGRVRRVERRRRERRRHGPGR